jgi:hypothetical protein
MKWRTGFIAVLVASSIGAPAFCSSLHIYSYDPANSETRHSAGALTFEFNRRLIVFTTILRVMATEGDAKAEVRPANERDLGPGGLTALIGRRAVERDLYEVETRDEGSAMIGALCPDSHRAWMAFGPIRANHDLRIYVLGDSPSSGEARLCKTLDYTFHGEWKGPSAAPMTPGPIEPPQFPQ